MLTRYKIHRGKRPPDDPLPDGIRQDTRKHTRHVLRPPEALVKRFLDNPAKTNWSEFERAYLDCLEQRFAEDRGPFDELAGLARSEDVYLGCNCPTGKNPDVRHCHTAFALRFMKKKYPKLKVRTVS